MLRFFAADQEVSMNSPIREDRKEEKINGKIIDMSPSANFRHGIVNNNINTIIKTGLKNSMCLVFMENLDLRYEPDQNDNYVIPDVMIVCDRKKMHGGSYHGIPKFIAETLSPATAMRDLTEKKDIYQAIGVSEYWIVSPKERGVQIYYLNDGEYKLVNSFILEDDADNRNYNADVQLALREFPQIKMTLWEIFEGVE
jgi:Uma2 family endonuclease